MIIIAICPKQLHLNVCLPQKFRTNTLFYCFLSLIGLIHTEFVFVAEDVGSFFIEIAEVCENLGVKACVTHALLFLAVLEMLPYGLMEFKFVKEELRSGDNGPGSEDIVEGGFKHHGFMIVEQSYIGLIIFKASTLEFILQLRHLVFGVQILKISF